MMLRWISLVPAAMVAGTVVDVLRGRVEARGCLEPSRVAGCWPLHAR